MTRLLDDSDDQLRTMSGIGDMLGAIFEAEIRLGGAYLLEQHEEWISGRRYFSEASMAPLLTPDAKDLNVALTAVG